jgi:alanine dehydrogenase
LDLLRPGLALFTYLHLAAAPDLAQALLEQQVTAIAYETVELPSGELPLLTPMSEVAGRLSIQVGAHYLEKAQGGAGKLLSGVPGVPPARVVILGTGVVGSNAAAIALGMGAQVTLLNRGLDSLRRLSQLLRGNLARFDRLAAPAPANRGARQAAWGSKPELPKPNRKRTAQVKVT